MTGMGKRKLNIEFFFLLKSCIDFKNRFCLKPAHLDFIECHRFSNGLDQSFFGAKSGGEMRTGVGPSQTISNFARSKNFFLEVRVCFERKIFRTGNLLNIDADLHGPGF